MHYQPSKKTRLVAAVAATLAFTGTLVAFAHAQEESTASFRIISTREGCIDYAIGQIIQVRVGATVPEIVTVNLGGENDEIVAEAVEPTGE